MSYISELFLCFIIFSFLGWCLEVAFGIVTLKRFVNRGFLVGPLCPLYGIGCVLLYLLLSQYADDPIILALASMTLCSVLEYVASYIMEKIFKTRWWDYTDMKYNINGRICLEMAVPFGILGLGVVYVLFPAALHILELLPSLAIYICAGVLLLLFLVDLAVSFKVIMKFTEAVGHVPKDMTEEITKFVNDTLSKQSKLTKRLIESFPNFRVNLEAIKNKIFKKRKKVSK